MKERIPNDGRFPDDSPVWIWYPPPHGTSLADTPPRDQWTWLPGSILDQIAPGEWRVAVEVRALATLEDGSPAPHGTPDPDLYYPACYRDDSEMRPRSGERP